MGTLQEVGVNPSIKVDQAAFIVQEGRVRESLAGLRLARAGWVVLFLSGQLETTGMTPGMQSKKATRENSDGLYLLCDFRCVFNERVVRGQHLHRA